VVVYPKACPVVWWVVGEPYRLIEVVLEGIAKISLVMLQTLVVEVLTPQSN